jgi:hypothetical protein
VALTMFAWLWARLYGWVMALGALVAAVGAAWLYGRHQGKEAAQDKAAAESAQANARAQHDRNEVDNETAKLPDAPPQKVGDADPDTAAGRLRDWTRD